MQAFFPVVLYCLGIVLVIVLIILCLKAIETLTKINNLIDDAQSKLNSLTVFFNLLDTVTDKVSVITDTVVSTVTNVITSIAKRKQKKEEEIDE